MQEYQLPIRETLTKGLRPRSDMGRGTKFLTTCDFMKPLAHGLRRCDDVIEPFASSEFSSWPYLQLLRGSSTLLAAATAIYPVTEGSPDWSKGSAYTTYDINNVASAKSITGSEVWHMADFGDAWMLFNGTTVVFKLNLEGMFDETNIVYVQNAIAIQSGCHHRGRLIMGGFDPANFFGDDWKGIWGYYLSKLPYAIDVDLDDIHDNFVFWSTIGGGDVVNLFVPELARDGVIKEDETSIEDSIFMELLKRNEMGFMPMPWQGSVLVVKPHEKGVVVYGEDGIAALVPTSDPYPTYGLRHLADFGIAGRGCVGGNEESHVFLDVVGNAWHVDGDFGLQKLGHKEFFEDIVGQDVLISHNSEHDEFFISGEDSSSNALSYVLTPNGLGKCPQQVAGAYNVEGEFLGVFSLDGSTIATIVTDIIDFGYRDLKTITTVEVGIDHKSAATVHVAVDYRYNAVDSWTRSDWVLVNPQGFARPQITAYDFRIAIKCSTYDDFEIDYINVRWQTSGRRTVRGLSAGTDES